MKSNERCIAHLESGGIVLAPDLRQARIFRRLHDRAQVAAGRRVWATAQVLPLEAWLQSLWERASWERPSLPASLSDAALRWLWRRQVENEMPQLLDRGDLGARARVSWLKLRAHGGDLTHVEQWPLTRDQQAFLAWSRQVEGSLRERNACDGGDLARLLVAHDALPPPGAPLLLAGFRSLSPAQEELFASLAKAGHSIQYLGPQAAPGESFLYCAPDPDAERGAMLNWLAARVAADPTGMHALIVTDLDANRGALERELAAALQPALELPGGQDLDRTFDIAGGHPLVMQPAVDSALTAIACLTRGVDWAGASRLLLSTHLADAASERGARIAADLALRREAGFSQFHAPQLVALATHARAEGLALAFRAASVALEGPRGRTAADWAVAFGAALGALRWPGSALGSREFQAAGRFQELLRELASMTSVASVLDAGEALAELRQLAESPFQAESGEPAIFVLDSFDDPGVEFDGLWVAGLTASTWPRAASVDPLLPIEIQRRLRMPRVTPEDCVAEAREILGRWRSRSGVLVLSWPRLENDTEADPSPLLAAGANLLPPVVPVPTRSQLAFEAGRLEPIVEAPIPALASPRAPGGARLLELQALCPFRAFAELRLGAPPMEEPQAGVDPKVRGILLHRALHALWASFGGQAGLLALADEERRARVDAAVDDALRTELPVGTGARTIAVERDWQRLAITQLLELDAARPGFVVIETERSREIGIGGLELRVRADRVDRVGDECIVIDYKTGTAKSKSWRGARMDAPQLPLYAVVHPERPTGIAFAAVGAADASYVGVARDAEAIPGLCAAEKYALTEDEEKGFSWPAIAAHWRAWLERLAADFAGGRTIVDPKLGAETCRLCHLEALCRVEKAAPDMEEYANDD